MAKKDVQDYDVMVEISKLVSDYITKGIIDPTQIAKGMGITRAEAMQLLDLWKSIARNTEDIKDRSTELILELDLTYSDVIKELYITLEECATPRDRNTTLKNIAEVTAKRQDVFQRAGLYDDAELASELADMEYKMEQLQKLLTTVADVFPETKSFIIDEIGRAMGKPVPMDVRPEDESEFVVQAKAINQ